MNTNRPVNLVYIPRMWPAVLASSFVALLFSLVAGWLGHLVFFLIISAVAICVGLLAFVLAVRRRVGLIPLALPSTDLRWMLFRLSLGLCWGTGLFWFFLRLWRG